MPVLVNHGYSNSRIGDARDRTFSGEFDDLGKANTATTSIRDRSSLKIHIEIRPGYSATWT